MATATVHFLARAGRLLKFSLNTVSILSESAKCLQLCVNKKSIKKDNHCFKRKSSTTLRGKIDRNCPALFSIISILKNILRPPLNFRFIRTQHFLASRTRTHLESPTIRSSRYISPYLARSTRASRPPILADDFLVPSARTTPRRVQGGEKPVFVNEEVFALQF